MNKNLDYTKMISDLTGLEEKIKTTIETIIQYQEADKPDTFNYSVRKSGGTVKAYDGKKHYLCLAPYLFIDSQNGVNETEAMESFIGFKEEGVNNNTWLDFDEIYRRGIDDSIAVLRPEVESDGDEYLLIGARNPNIGYICETTEGIIVSIISLKLKK